MAEIDFEADEFELGGEDFSQVRPQTGADSARPDDEVLENAPELGELGASIEAEPAATAAPAAEGLMADFEIPGILRPEALLVQGVDDMSTKDVYKYVSQYVPKDAFTIEWIDDTSVAVVFRSDSAAATALSDLTSEAVFYDGTSLTIESLREAKVNPEKPSTKLKVRIAFDSDRKARRAGQKSRYYQKYGVPTFESERYRVHVPDANTAGFREGPTQDEPDLFPERTAGAVDTGDLFPDHPQSNGEGRELGDRFGRDPFGRDRPRSRSPGRRRDRENHDRNRNRNRDRRDRDRSPDRRARPAASRDLLAPGMPAGSWAKGDLLADRIQRDSDLSSRITPKDRKGRRRAADLF